MSTPEGSPPGNPRKRFKYSPPTPQSSVTGSGTSQTSSQSSFDSQQSIPGLGSDAEQVEYDPAQPKYSPPPQPEPVVVANEPEPVVVANEPEPVGVANEPAPPLPEDPDDMDTLSTEESEDEFPPQITNHYLNNAQHLGGLIFEDFDAVYSNGHEQYVFIERLGSGTYASVFKGQKAEGFGTRHLQEVAIKVAKPTTPAQWAALNRELDIVDVLSDHPHPNISFVSEYFENVTQTAHYLISDLAPIGDLFRVLTQVNSQNQVVWVPLKTQYCRHLIRGIALGVQHLFSLGISHGDIKFENILIDWYEPEPNTPQDYRINRFMRMVPKLTDFNNSKMGVPGEPIMHATPRCTLHTAAPESWHTNGVEYDMKRADVYSVGACLLSMLLGCYPFDALRPLTPDVRSFVYTRNKKDRQLINDVLKPFDYSLKQVLLKVLEPIPQNRVTIEEFLADNWFTQRLESEGTEGRWEHQLWKGIPYRERKHSV